MSAPGKFDVTRIGVDPGSLSSGNGVQSLPSDPTLAAAVERYRALGEGFYPIPLVPNSKKPAQAGWQRGDGTVDWAGVPANANLGLAIPPGRVLLDEDVQNGGDVTLAALVKTHGPLPRTWLQRTGSGGTHRLFRASPRLAAIAAAGTVRTNLGKILSGIDLKLWGRPGGR